MSKKLIARTAKLLTDTKKSRRKGVAITYEHIPRDIDERNHGSIYAVIHINAPVPEAQEIAELIIDAFHGEYYQDLNKEPLLSFEAALSKINEELSDATHDGNISWLNNMNAILGVLSGDVLHMTKAGKTEAYLYRGDKQSHISNDLSGDVVNPARTFINIASGELSEGDKIAIVTPGVFFHISKGELQKYVQEFQPRVAISHIADLLEGTTNEVSPNAVLILEAITPEAASNETLEEQPDEVWISEPTKPMKSAVAGATPVLAKIFSFFKIGILGAMAFVAEQIFPLFGKVTPKAQGLINRSQARAAHAREKVLTETQESLTTEEPKEDLEDLTIRESDEVIGQKAPEVEQKPKANEIFIKEENTKPKWLKLEKVNFPRFGGLKTKMNRSGRGILANKKALVILSVIILVLFAGGVYYAYRGESGGDNAQVSQSSLAEAKNRYEEGKSALESGDKVRAATLLREAESLTEGLLSDEKLSGEANNLLGLIRKALDEAESVVRINPSVFADASEITGENVLGPYLLGTKLYLINKDNGSIAEIDTKSGEVANVLDDPDIGKILAATPIPTRSIIVLASDNGNIYEFDAKEATTREQDISGEIEKIIAMTSFSTNIYTLDSAGNIYKRQKTSTGYAKRTSYITDGSNVAGAVAIATDSNMYAITPSGEISKYLSGKEQNFPVINPSKLSGVLSLFADEDVASIYFSDKTQKKIIKISDKGILQKQVVSDSFANLSGVYISGNVLYIGSGGKIYRESS